MRNTPSDSAVAIIGMACRLPGAPDLDKFWDLVRTGRTAWGPVPESRFHRELYYHPERGTLNKSYSDLAALVEYGPVDRSLCPISDSAIAMHDLAHVTLCEVAASACRHAGFDPTAIPYANTGVYVGHASASGVAAELTLKTYISQTARYLRETAGVERLTSGLGEQLIHDLVDIVRGEGHESHAQPTPLLGASHAARLIAETFGFNGPCMSFNAACASSSRALVQAVRALQLGNIDMALVGGASFFHSDTLVLFAQSHSLSPNGSCPFTDQADGMIVGEGYVTLVLKLLGRAIADKDHIFAVIPSVGTSSDGHGKSLWAPRFEGQVKAIERAYGTEVSLDQLQYIEAHATSTALGDVTEVKALSTVLEGKLPAGTRLPIGSAKLNVGHTLESAGLVGVLKTVLALQHETIPPTVPRGILTPDIDWDRVPLYAPSEAVAWAKSPHGIPRRAGVDAFGIGGLNVHVVIDEYVPARAASVAGTKVASPAAARPSRGTDEDAIAIIGMGAVLPGALTRDAFWELLASGRDPKINVPANRWDAEAFHNPEAQSEWETPTTLGGFVTGFSYDWRKHKIPPKQIQQASPLQFMILDAVDQAIQQANYHQRTFDRQKVGVVVGAVFGGDYSAQLVMGLRLPYIQRMLAQMLREKGVPEDQIAPLAKSYGEVLLKHMPALLDETGSFTASALASRITKSFDLMGGAVAVDAGQASSLAALSCCVDQLRSGDCEMMICVGGENDMTPTLYADWALGGRLARSGVPSPFDVRADGVVPGEGCGAVLLKRLTDARRDNDPILGIIRGIGAARETCSGEAARMAVERSLADGKLKAADVSLVELSPTGLPDNDTAEIQGLADAYHERAATGPLQLGTAVGQIGDTYGASGMAALLKATLEVERVELPVTPGLTHTAPYLTRHRAVLAVPHGSTSISVSNADGRLIAGVHSGGKLEVSYHVHLERGTKLKPTPRTTPNNGQVAASPSPGGEHVADRIIHFDATTRRRDKKRLQAQGSGSARPEGTPQTVASNGSAGKHARPAAPPPVASSKNSPVQPEPRSAAPKPVAPAKPITAASSRPATPPTPAPATPPQPRFTAAQLPPVQPKAAPAYSNGAVEPVAKTSAESSDKLNAKELEAFLVNFVVEQTGYPVEIVELDADLEADLGIDSIKKAQLFGELGEYFEVQASEDLSLDDFPTLRHVLDFLLKAQGASSPASVAPTPEAKAPTAKASSSPTAAAEPMNGTVHHGSKTTPSASDKLNAQELEAFLVNFVVEQTGYPVEIVELDADLEADLGIDSIKKAQLFGELGEYFEVQASEDLSLDDFPTLRHVLNFLLKSQGASEAAASAAPLAASAPVAPAAASAMPQMNGASAPATKAATANSDKLNAQELEAFLVNFVVEQTGYPVEIVELDADLEADLGIDSIKKAQLFGELGEYFEVQASEDLSLDDFPTLRHVLDFLLKSQCATAAPSTGSPAGAPPPMSATSVSVLPNGVHSNGAYPNGSAVKAAASASDKLNAQELEAFLVNFVVEQTGYPVEIVELDADLEADLGIDSIKKAQLFGELGEYFEVQASEDLSLDDFPTLRHVLDYLLKSQGVGSAAG